MTIRADGVGRGTDGVVGELSGAGGGGVMPPVPEPCPAPGPGTCPPVPSSLLSPLSDSRYTSAAVSVQGRDRVASLSGANTAVAVESGPAPVLRTGAGFSGSAVVGDTSVEVMNGSL
ncbi:hypothetical protein EES45_08565 [Streptomyces sp. ADI97-07]|nr:hypothetical protein EES45_08565 [Streptomyces sp. ADI97-07]